MADTPAVNTAAAGIAGPGPQLDDNNPWPGLAAYDESAREYFHGRKEEAAELLRLVRLAPATALYGKSGLGKSSLLMAGLFPLLRDGHFLPVYLRLNVANAQADAPNVQIMRALTDALHKAKAEFTPPGPDESAWHYLHRADLELWSADNYPLVPVLVFDQFEELFAPRPADAPSVESVMNLLGDLIEPRVSDELTDGKADRADLARLDLQRLRYRVLVSFREDYLAPMKSWERRIPSLLRNYLDLKPMARERAVDAVAKPGAKLLAEGVAERIVDFVGALDTRPAGVHGGAAPAVDGAIEPVLLSLCCHQLNMRRAGGAKIDQDLLDKFGQDILHDFYRDSLAGMPPSVAEFIEDELVQGDRYRAAYPYELALAEQRIEPDQLRALTDKHRLLRIDPQGGVRRIELIHDRMVGVVVAARNERTEARLAMQRETARLDAIAAAEHERQVREADIERQRAQAAALADARSARRQRNVMIGALSVIALMLATAVYQWDRANDKTKQARDLSKALAAQVEFAESESKKARDAQALAELARQDAEVSAAEAKREREEAQRQEGIAKKQTEIARRQTRRAEELQERMRNLFVTATGTRLAAQAQNAMLGTREAGEPLAMQQLAIANRLTPNNVNVRQLTMSVLTERALLAKAFDAGTTVSSVAVSPDGGRIAVGGDDGVLRLFDARSGLPVAPRTGPADPANPDAHVMLSLAFSPDGSLVASGSDDGIVRLWDARTAAPASRDLKAHEDWVRAVAFSPDGKLLASAGDDGKVLLRDGRSGALVHEFDEASKDWVRALAFSPDGRRLAFGGSDQKLHLIDVEQRQIVKVSSAEHRAVITAIAFSGDGRQIVTGAEDGTLRRWNAETAAVVGAPWNAHEGPITSLAWQPGAQVYASASEDRSVRLWNANSTARRAELFRGSTYAVRGVAFSGDGQMLATGGDDRTLRLWHLQGLKEGFANLRNLASPVAQMQFQRDGQRLAGITFDGRAIRWSARGSELELRGATRATSTATRAISQFDVSPAVVALSADGSRMLSANPQNQRLQQITLSTGAPLGAEFGGHDRTVRALAYAPDGQRAASGGDDGIVRLWDLATGNELWRSQAQQAVANLAFSPDGQALAVGLRNGGLRVWASAGGRALADLRGHADMVVALAFSPDGRRLASGGVGGELRIWDWRSGAHVTLIGHTETVSALGFSPDGQQLASGSADRSVRLWRVADAAPIGVALKGHTGTVSALAFSPDGSMLASAGRDRRVYHWPLFDRWPALVCGKLAVDVGPRRWGDMVSSDLPYAKPCPGLPDDDASAAPPPKR